MLVLKNLYKNNGLEYLMDHTGGCNFLNDNKKTKTCKNDVIRDNKYSKYLLTNKTNKKQCF